LARTPSAGQGTTTKVTVNLVGHIFDIVQEKTITIVLETPTVKGLIEKMADTYGPDLRKAILKEGTEELYVLVLVNSKDIDFLQKLDTPLTDGDRVDVIPLVAGG